MEHKWTCTSTRTSRSSAPTRIRTKPKTHGTEALQFAQCRWNRQARCTNCGQQSADEAYEKGVGHTGCKQRRGDAKGEGHSTEVLEVHRGCLVPIEPGVG